MGLPARSTPAGKRCRPAAGWAHQHLVELYETDAQLTATVVGFLRPGLGAGDAAIVVATAGHRAAFRAGLASAGVAMSAAIGSHRYLEIDAAELLDTFMIGGAPHAGRFRETVGDLVNRHATGSRRVWIYGEMVALLWAGGDIDAAVELEDLWNALAVGHDFELLCAYPSTAFEGESLAETFQLVCDQHTAVLLGGT